jgi:hypothetical protein
VHKYEKGRWLAAFSLSHQVGFISLSEMRTGFAGTLTTKEKQQ